MPQCERKYPSHCNGEDVRKVQMKTKQNVYDGDIIEICAGCRGSLNGQFKYVKEPKADSLKHRADSPAKPRAKISRSYNAKDIENWKFEDQELPQEWADHLGEIPGVWSMYVDGHPGQGKTEYIMQLAKMLAMNVGKVKLNNVEQGKHKQIKQSAVRNQFSKSIPAGKFSYDNIRDFDRYLARIKRPNSGRIQIIDSISYWPLSLKEVQYLLENFKKKCFVFVAYEKHYSVNEPIIHHCDIKVRVSNYTAKVTATRYGGLKDFVIWDKKAAKAQLELPIESSN